MAKSGKQKGPAAPTSKHPAVRKLEGDARGFYHLQKKLLNDGPEAAIAALRELTPPGADPSQTSLGGLSEVMQFIDPTMDHGEKFLHPRRRGAVDDLGALLEEIVRQDQDISNAAAWESLRSIAGLSHPVVQEVDDEKIYYRSGGKERAPLTRKGFESRMTRARNPVK